MNKIEEALDNMQKRGRCRGLLINSYDNVCLIGSFIEPMGWTHNESENGIYALFNESEEGQALTKVIKRKNLIASPSSPAYTCYNFNDSVSDDEQVYEVMRLAAKELNNGTD